MLPLLPLLDEARRVYHAESRARWSQGPTGRWVGGRPVPRGLAFPPGSEGGADLAGGARTGFRPGVLTQAPDW